MDKKRINVTLTKPYLDALDHLVEMGIYLEYQTAVRDALRHLLEAHGVPPFYTGALPAEEAEHP